MPLFRSLELGHYDPIWKNICINDQNLKKIKNNNAEFFHTLVAIHENTHWQQLTSSTLGHFISFFPYFKRYTVRNFLLNFHQIDPSIQIQKPLMPWIMNFENTCTNENLLLFIKMLKQDLYSIDLAFKYLNSEFSNPQLKDQWKYINQALFACNDLYLQFTKPYIKSYDPEKLIEKNRTFWDKKENYQIPILSVKTRLSGFTDLVECGARLVELKYYITIKNKRKIIGNEFLLDEKYLFQEDYFIPLKFYKMFFGINTITIESIDLLSAIIFISLNPPITPHFNFCYNNEIWVRDIHPGVRFFMTCGAIKKKFSTLKQAISIPQQDLLSKISEINNWPTSQELSEDYKNNFLNLESKSESLFDGDELFDNQAVTDIELWLIYFYRANQLRRKYLSFFVNSAEYYFDFDKIEALKLIDNTLHCPVVYDSTDEKYKISTGGLNFSSYDLKTKNSESIGDTKKNMSNRLQQLAINFIRDGLFDDLNEQLLHRKGTFNMSILSKIDAPISLKNDLLQMYQERNYVNLNKIVIN